MAARTPTKRPGNSVAGGGAAGSASPGAPRCAPGFARRGWRLLALAAALPVAVQFALFLGDVPLGKPGTITYPYSTFAAIRVQRVPQMAALALLLGAAVLLVADVRRARRGLGYALALAAAVSVGLWSLTAPPAWQRQQFFNMLSPSHDGAFFVEAEYAQRIGVGRYLRDFQQRAATSPAELRGTRIISNPPGTTLLAVAVDQALQASPGLGGFFGRLAVDDPTLPRPALLRAGRALAFSLALIAAWLLSGVLLFAAIRVFVPVEIALAAALLAIVSPMTVLFTPGKDPAQLATVGAIAFAWLRGRRGGGRALYWSAAAGAATALGCFVSLVHIWVTACLVAATLLSRRRGAVQAPALPALVALAIGFAATCGILQWLGYDVVAASLAVARAQAEVTHGPAAMPLRWQLLGLPLFVLFCGPGPLAAVALSFGKSRRADPADALARALLLVTLGVMAATIGFTNLETPRLWIPFSALLICGGAIRAAQLDARVRVKLLALLVVFQVAGAAVQWSMMDMREAELRLRIDAHGGARFFD